jgi:uncharacterized delta-60 repeat protein
VARYLANGTLDSSFGNGGKTRINFAAADTARDVVIQPDGKILIVGGVSGLAEVGKGDWFHRFLENDWGLVRLTSDGKLDKSFGNGGKVTTNFSGTDWAEAVALQNDGKIVVVGNGGDDFGVARYLSNGQLDTSFGEGGKIRVNFAGVDTARDVVIQRDGKIIVVGAANNEMDFGVMKLLSNGKLDTSFGEGGKIKTNFSGVDWAEAVGLQSDGKIVVAGRGGDDFAVARYLTNGKLDTSFGDRGKTRVNFAAVDTARDVAIQLDGKILVVGGASGQTFHPGLGYVENDFGMMRLTASGKLDTSFGDRGKVRTNFSGTDWAEAVTIQADGKIVVVGSGGDDLAIARYRGTSVSTEDPGGPPANDTDPDGTNPDPVDPPTEESPDSGDEGGNSGETDSPGNGGEDTDSDPADSPTEENPDSEDEGGNSGNTDTTGGAPEWLKSDGVGSVQIFGTEGNDRLVVTKKNGVVVFSFNGETLGVSHKVSRIVFGGEKGADYFENRTNIASEVYGGEGDDTLIGGAGNDRLYGQDGDDTMKGQGGNDHIEGGLGSDKLYGGAGNDELVAKDGTYGNDIIEGGAGKDAVVDDPAPDPVPEATLVKGRLAIQGSTRADNVTVGLVGKEVIVSFNGRQERFVAASVKSIDFRGGKGNDRFTNQTSIASAIYGDQGNDTLFGGGGNDVLDGGAGNDRLEGGGGHDKLYGQQGADTLIGGTGNDLLEGGSENDRIYGQDGNDTLRGQGGNDRVVGGAGDDAVSGGDGNDRVEGGVGNDKLWGDDGNDVLLGQDGNDVLYGGQGNDSLLGGTDNDLLEGGSGNDKLDGQDGNDTLRGQRGDDRVIGGTGDDALSGGEGNDRVEGGIGNDTLWGDAGNDVLLGQQGVDVLYGGQGADHMQGGQGDDTLLGGEGRDEMFGQDGNDKLYGGAGNDRLEGGDGDDLLNGEEGDDVAYGNRGRDEFFAGLGNDNLFGGLGIDVFHNAKKREIKQR